MCSFFLFCTGTTQVVRVLMYQSQQNKDGIAEEAKKAIKDEGKVVADVAKHPEQALQKVAGK